jgi:hypothetical protein
VAGDRLFFFDLVNLEDSMSQKELDRAVADATGENIGLIRGVGFSIADPLDVSFDPEPRSPSVFDWNSMSVAEWPGI